MFQHHTLKLICRRLRRPFEWTFIWIAYAVIPFLPHSAVLRLAHFIAAVGYLFDQQGKAVSRANLRVMFGTRLTPIRERRIILRAYRNFACVLVNVFWMSRQTRKRMMENVSFSPLLQDLLRKHRPAITISAHLGNWEILPLASVVNGIPAITVAKMLGTPEMTAHLIRLRAPLGHQFVPTEGALRHLIQALKQGTNIALLVDQHVSPLEGGTWVTLFGLPVSISLAPAILSRKYKVPIIFAWSRPLKAGHYRIELGQIFMPDPTIDDTTRTQQIITAFEQVIRRHPSLWCLNYRGWRYILPNTDPSPYPFYARPYS